MRYCQHIIVVALLMQLLVLCLARKRFADDTRPVAASRLEGNDDSSSSDTSSINENESSERANPWTWKAKKSLRRGYFFGNEDRRKKYLGESGGFHGGHSLQGLWAMPGRRR